MTQNFKAARKPYSAPAFEVLDLSSAKAKFAAIEASDDIAARQMFAAVNQQIEKQKSVVPSPALSFLSH